jgi:alpha-tubulin suppressor-like RCC1 family protein
VDELAAGTSHTCASSRRTMWCWGSDQRAQLGPDAAGTDAERLGGSTRPIEAPGLAGATAVVAGSEHTCATSSEGEVRCWGDGRRGQIDPDDHRIHRRPSVVGRAEAIAAGGDRTCWARGAEVRCVGSVIG